jgi:hypothetical protein
MVTDTVFCPDSLPKELPNLEVVPSAELSAVVIRTIMTNNSIGTILTAFNAEEYLRSPDLFNQP